MSDLYTVNDLAKSCNIPPSTIRYYIKLGLLTPTRVTTTGYQLFNPIAAKERIALIKSLKDNRWTLEEIKNYIGGHMVGKSNLFS